MQNTRLDFIIDYSAVVHANSKGLTLIIMNHFLIIPNLFDLILSFNQIVRILIMIPSIIFVEMIFLFLFL